MRPEVWVGMGSNLGNRQKWLQFGLDSLVRLAHRKKINRVSDIYETDPWGDTDQPAFLNAVCSLTPAVEDPVAFLGGLKAIEARAGRDPDEPRWGPRTLDLDILFWGQLVYATDHLVIPHPGIPDRRFVLVPLCQLASDLKHPGTGLTVKQMLDLCPDQGSVRFWGKFIGRKEYSASP